MEEYYYTITQTMVRDLGLKGNELLVYAIINMFSQMKAGSFYGSLATLREMTGIGTKQTAIATLQSLMKKGLITRTDAVVEGEKRILYSVPVVKKLDQGGQIIRPGEVQKFDQGGKKIVPNNNSEDNTLREGDNPPARPRFVPPTREEVVSYCNTSGLQINIDRFLAHYESNGWRQSNGLSIKDWKATVRTWYYRDHPEGKPTPAPAQEHRLAQIIKERKQNENR